MPSLRDTNGHIRTKTQRKDSIARAVISSGACEGIFIMREDLHLQRYPYA